MVGATPVPALDEFDGQQARENAARAFRLTDAERIAQDRLRDAHAGSLKEALANTVVDATLSDRLADVAPVSQFAAHTPFQAAPGPTSDWMEAVPPAHTVPFFEPALGDVPPFPVPEFASPDVVSPAPSMPVAEPVPQARAEDDEPVNDVGEGHAQELALTLLAPEHASQRIDAGMMSAPDDVPPTQLAIERATSAVADSLEVRIREEFGVADDPRLDPIVSAFAANARLAADATAASQALHQLKLMLVDRLEDGQAARVEPVQSMPQQVIPQPQPAPVMDYQVAVAVPEMPPVMEASAPVVSAPMPERVAEPQAPLSEMIAAPASPPRLVQQSPVLATVEPVSAPSPFKGLPLELPPEELPQIVSKARVLNREPAHKPVPPVAKEAKPALRLVPKQPTEDIRREPDAARVPPDTAVAKRKSTEVTQPRRVAPAKNLPVPVAATPAKALAVARGPALPQKSLRAPFDMRGFVAGFVLSGAVGLLLYLFMAAI